MVFISYFNLLVKDRKKFYELFKYILIMKKFLQFFMIFFVPFMINGQKIITGNVTDAVSKEGLIGVSVLVKDTTAGSITDIDGNFSIKMPKGKNTLVFSYVGYQTQEIDVSNLNSVNIRLVQGKLLEDVVVIGYGTVKRTDVTGTLQTVNNDKFNKGAITGAQELLAGKIPGVTITTDGGPGNGSKIRIRGESSLTASNDPLIVIDGVPVDNNTINGGRNILNTINPNDIENMTVLKDASSAAIYGNRASGGVILITTKKGKMGDKFKVGYEGKLFSGKITKTIDVLDSARFLKVVRTSLTEGERNEVLSLVGNSNTDWQKEIYQNAIGHEHNLYFSGSTKFLPYRVSLNYNDNKGILKTDRFTRYLGSINLNPQFFNNRLQIGIYAKGMKEKNKFADKGAIGNAISFDPTQTSAYNDTVPYGGYFAWLINDKGRLYPDGLAPTNPLALLKYKDDKSDVTRYVLNSTIDYRFKFLPDLRANLNLGFDKSLGKGTVNIPANIAVSYNDKTGGGANNEYEQTKKNSLLEFYLNYKKVLGKHSIDLMSGYSWQHFYFKNYSLNANAARTPSEIQIKNTPYELYLLSMYGRFNYGYNDRYLFTFTLRRDGTSRFAPGKRWGLFPSAAIGVKLIDNKNKYFNNMKLRLGWGIIGQENLSSDPKYYYAYLANYQASYENASYQFGDRFYSTLRPNGYDENIKWEENETYNLGLDMSIIKSKLTASFDIYRKNTYDLLNEIPLPAGTNLTNFIVTNVGNMKAQGVEFSLNTFDIGSKNFNWDFSVNFAYNKSEVTKLLATTDTTYKGVLTGGIAGGVGGNIQIYSVGYAPKSFFVYQQLYDENGKILEGKFVDRNNDGIINDNDKYQYKKPDPDYTIGFTSSFDIYNFNLAFAGRASIGNYIYNNVQTNIGWYGNILVSNGLRNLSQSAVDLNVYRQSNLSYSDHFIQDASFLKLDHVTLSYNFKQMKNMLLKVYGTVQNPFVMTKYVGIDPEISNGIDNDFYPRARTLIFGVNINL